MEDLDLTLPEEAMPPPNRATAADDSTRRPGPGTLTRDPSDRRMKTPAGGRNKTRRPRKVLRGGWRLITNETAPGLDRAAVMEGSRGLQPTVPGVRRLVSRQRHRNPVQAASAAEAPSRNPSSLRDEIRLACACRLNGPKPTAALRCRWRGRISYKTPPKAISLSQPRGSP